MEVAKQQQKELAKTRKEYEKEKRLELEKKQKLQEFEEDFSQIKTKFNSL